MCFRTRKCYIFRTHPSRNGLAKGPRADAVVRMPPPTNVSQLRSFLGSIQFYNKFLPNLSSISQPLHTLTQKNVTWGWGEIENNAFNELKRMLTKYTVLIMIQHAT